MRYEPSFVRLMCSVVLVLITISVFVVIGLARGEAGRWFILMGIALVFVAAILGEIVGPRR